MRNTHRKATYRTVILILIGLILIGGMVTSYLLSQEESDSSSLQNEVTLFLSYIPSVQFAPVYVALERGYFADEGITVTLEHSLNEADGIDRLAAGNLQFGIVSGEQVMLARANERPVVYIFEWYHNFPVGIVSRAALDITEPADLAGRVVGLPGPYGASYIGLRALLAAADLREDDLKELRTIGYTAVENICEERVEAAVIYVVNEPLTIEQECAEVNVIHVSTYATLVSNGLATNEDTIKNNPDLVSGMVRAIQRGLADTLADPDAAFELSVAGYVSDLPEDQYATQRQVLENTLALWQSSALGQTEAAAWIATQQILLDAGLIEEPLADLEAAYDMRFLP